MTSISNVERLVLLLRQKLEARSRASQAPRAKSARMHDVGGVATARALAAIDDVDERQLRRILIQGLLADQFGAAVINDANFQQVVDRVAATIEGDKAGKALMDRISRELRAAARS